MKRTKKTQFFIRNGLALILLLVFSSFATAQGAKDDQPIYGNGAAFARVTVLDGSATVSRDSAGDMAASRNFTIEPLDVFTTHGNGRAVIQFIDGTLLKLDTNTKVEFLEIGSSDNGSSLSILARLWNGSILSDVSDDSTFQQRSFRIDTEDCSIYMLSNGKYRIDRNGGETDLKVISGSAEVSENGGSTLFHSGEMGRASRGYANISKSYFNTFDMDDFDMWARNTYDRRPAASAQYVPTEIRHYVTELDSNGTWYYDTSLATYVWHPNIVDVSWEPYSYGYWAWSPYGMTWTSYYDWGYAPFHYGAWDFSVSFGWVWVPGSYYSPAWVSWNCWDSYVGWYPYNRYYYRRYRRGRVVGRYGRHHRVVYTSVDRLTRRQHRLTTRELPGGRNVVRVNNPIVPNPTRLRRQPREAIRGAVNRPITRQVILKQRTVSRELATSRIARGFSSSGNRSERTARSAQNSGSRFSVQKPGTRNTNPIISRGETSRSERSSRGNHSSIHRNNTRTGNGNNITVRTPVIRNRSVGSTTTRSIRENRTNSGNHIIRRPSSSNSSGNRSVSPSRTIRSPRRDNASSNRTPSYSRSITVTRPSHSSVPSRSTRSYTRPIRTTPSYRTPRSSRSYRSYTRPSITRPIVSRPGTSRSTRSYSRSGTSHSYSRSSRSSSPTVTHRSSSRSSSRGSRRH